MNNVALTNVSSVSTETVHYYRITIFHQTNKQQISGV